ncbi:hypothetical protein [Variovorax sp. 350MFTsu5.1]|uniref:hypothetical protein n=1 Tax=Variovorax sp. 350MFTsu5.1 TaxID=3158365 RepID=UPI003AAAE235
MAMSGLVPRRPEGDAERQRRAASSFRDIVIALLLAAVSFLIFNSNGRLISAGDTYPARYLPFSILTNHSVLLDPVARIVAQGRSLPKAEVDDGTAFWIMKGRDGRLVSRFPLVVPVVVSPLYLPAVSYLESIGWDPHVFDKIARVMEKLCASLITATSVAFLYLLLRRRSSPRTAAALSIVFAFGTTAWVISSQALWMHGLAQFLIITTMWLITGPSTLTRVMLAGFLCALIGANRQPDALLAAAIGLLGLRWAGKRWPWFVLSGAVPFILTLVYNLGTVGHVAGSYGLSVHIKDINDNVAEGVAGLLFSPTRGLFVFSPFLLFVPCLIVHALRDRSVRDLTIALCVAMVALVAGYAVVDWRQGIAWGPRWLSDMVPLLIWMLPPILAAISRAGRALFAATCVLSIAIQIVGAFWYTGTADAAMLAGQDEGRMKPMWELRNAPFIAELKHPRAPADLFVDMRGNVDLIDIVEAVVPHPVDGERVERQLDVAGWALVDSSSPHDVAVLIDGIEAAGTSHFFERPDVRATVGVESPAGWRLRAPVSQLQPGKHLLSAVVRARAGGDVRVLRERTFELPAESTAEPRERFLAHASRVAVERIAQGQQTQGYWLTSFTKAARFDSPEPELNTYLNAIMLDIATPIAAAAQMQEMLARARSYLSSQIEADGLVRYHGRPDAPTIGVLGCAITPDSDDTALTWRVAPGEDRTRLTAALRAIKQFRTSDGLYRTWLAQRSDFQCLDPGSDPNPADIGIQMHVYLMLAQEDPPAARALCQALMRRSDDAGIWVYYSGAPPMAVLRLGDLHRAGCPLELPASRLQPTDPAQATWVRAASLINQMNDKPQSPAVQAEATQLLLKLASNDFAALRSNPPLLYHNDLTATVRRYYWSQEVGYALWLRLHYATRGVGLLPEPLHKTAGAAGR